MNATRTAFAVTAIGAAMLVHANHLTRFSVWGLFGAILAYGGVTTLLMLASHRCYWKER
jgi:hypothetical protein